MRQNTPQNEASEPRNGQFRGNREQTAKPDNRRKGHFRGLRRRLFLTNLVFVIALITAMNFAILWSLGRTLDRHFAQLTSEQRDSHFHSTSGREADIRQGMVDSVFLALAAVGTPLALLLLALQYRQAKRHIVLPLEALERHAELMATGNLSEDVPQCHTNDELEWLSLSLSRLQDALRRALEGVVECARALGAGGLELGVAAQEVSEGAYSQAASLQQVAGSLQQMGAAMTATRQAMEHGQRRLSRSTASVEEVADASARNLGNVDKIAHSVQLIVAMAEQTNVLSLNASLEAARAGANGGRFAVVAKEVGALASETGQAALLITDTARKTIGGVRQLNANLQAALPELTAVGQTMLDIRNRAVEHDAGAQQLNAVLEQLTNTAQGYADKAEQVADLSLRLKDNALRINDLLRIFRV